jgi:hypothetical protein
MNPDKAYPKQIEGKLEALDFDTMLSSSKPFEYFYDYVEKHSTFSKPYFDLYILSRLY